MASEFAPVMLCSGAIGINFVYNIRKGNDVFVPLLAGGVFTTACVLVSSVEPAIGTALAGIFFLSVFLARGEEFIDFAASLTGTTTATKGNRP
jgi:hypothetical protein